MTDNRAQELIETIRFYAEPRNYLANGIGPSRINIDAGLRARSFLAQFEAAD